MDEIEAAATDLGPAHRRQLARVAFNVRLLYRLVEDLKQDRNRHDELRWRLHEFKLLTIQLSHLRASVAIFDAEATRRFADRRPVVLNQENWAKQLEDIHSAWLEKERRANLHRPG
jgi:flagellar biosynthesis regulator FlaF